MNARRIVLGLGVRELKGDAATFELSTEAQERVRVYELILHGPVEVLAFRIDGARMTLCRYPDEDPSVQRWLIFSSFNYLACSLKAGSGWRLDEPAPPGRKFTLQVRDCSVAVPSWRQWRLVRYWPFIVRWPLMVNTAVKGELAP